MTETDSRSELAAKPAARLAPAAEALATVSRTRALPRDARASGAEGTLPRRRGRPGPRIGKEAAMPCERPPDRRKRPERRPAS